MTTRSRAGQWTIFLYLALGMIAIPHLIDDFLFGIPEEFGISNQTAQILAGLFTLVYMAILIPLASGRKPGLYGALVMGIFLALAGILKHIPLMLLPGPYWSGAFSEVLIIGLIFSGLACSFVAFLALRGTGRQ